ncbi:SIR2 family protein [Labrys neptuniae]|uniref:SIR2 family protein n=1 Tax=Labrys neptuniae TaxID=376174 RepID=UPI00288F6981|nr:SIR2 family protein [Labrys neptuniae]MDT3377347.1 SIR2 family protein [Labrys neptuniae]
MTALTEATAKILQSKGGAPFLFVGSGFSRRYLGLEDWSGLLSRFCDGIREFNYYLASANSKLPAAASLIAKDFHDIWWTNEKYASARAAAKDGIKSIDAALKREIATYLSGISLEGLADGQIQKELAALKNLNVDGIITTNWDFLLEELFPEYRPFIGQEELLFSNPQAIAEIYKIHGCASKPDSLVLTEADYADFERKNPYLAAKLITLFIEHPIFFIGYSINDPHIQSLIFSIASCLGSDKLDQFSENLIFVRRSSGKGSSTQKLTFSGGGKSFTATVLETDDFCEVYSAIEVNKRKIPARILRYCKEQMYELVKSSEPEKKLAVLDIDELDASDEVEFVVGVGVAKSHVEQQKEIASEEEQKLAESGYKGATVADLFADFLSEKSKFDAPALLNLTFPTFVKSNTTFIPLFRYLRDAGIDTKDKLAAADLKAVEQVLKKIKDRGYQVKGYRGQFDAHWKGKSTAEIIAGVEAAKVALFVPFQHPSDVDLNVLQAFLQENASNDFIDPYKSFFKKLACYYDFLRFGFPT